MPTLDPADCAWRKKSVIHDKDINGDIVSSVVIWVCIAPGHLGHERRLPAGVNP